MAKSNTLKRSSANGFRFKWWMAVILIAIIALIGIIVLRFSHAGTKPNFTAAELGCTTVSIYGIPLATLRYGEVDARGVGCVHYYQSLLHAYQINNAWKTNVNVLETQPGTNYWWFGPNDVTATKYFQSANGLPQTGEVGATTWGAIIKACYVDLRC